MLDGIIEKDKTPTPPRPPSMDKLEEKAKDVASSTAAAASATASSTTTPRTPPRRMRSKSRSKESAGSSSPERLKNEVLQTMKRGKARKEELSAIKSEKSEDKKDSADSKRKPFFNYIYYDPELHWCSTCDIFPKTAKDYLNHLHTEQHQARAAAENTSPQQEYPWRAKLQSDEQPHYPDVPNKRTPIRGLQFFVPATAWYCKICNFWMGDLHCASVHLKSVQHGDKYSAYIDTHRNFEMDWMSDRQKAYERTRDSEREQQASTTTADVPSVSSIGKKGDAESVDDGDAAIKKKKNKKSERREKKKKKRSKKKKKKAASSSSSSSSSSDSESDSDKKSSSKGDDFDPATSIRVAMRNILKAQEAASKEADSGETAGGKWTVVQTPLPAPELTAPPPPFMTAGAESREKKRDELMLSQWVTPDPIISDSEKKLLENLKGKLKKRDDDRDFDRSGKPRESSREGSRGRDRPGSRGPDRRPSSRDGDHRGRPDSRGRLDDWKRSRSKTPPWRRRGRSPGGRRDFGRDRRSPDRRRGGIERGGRFDRRRRSRSRGHRSPSYGRGRFRMRRSYSRSRSRTRSGSRGRRVIEKPVVNFPPEPKPKPEKKVKKDDEKKEKKSVTMAIGQKKLPFIGRMPVFKKQQQEVKKEGQIPTEKSTINQDAQVENGTKHQTEEFVDMMPDPFQYVALMGAPPPPPATHPGKPDEILPPGIDEAEADSVPKPISDAPIPRKGPLPKDFQEALDILFDGDKPKPAELIANETKPPELPPVPVVPVLDTDQPQMIIPEAIEIYNQQIAAQYSGAVVQANPVSYDDDPQNQPLDMEPSNDSRPAGVSAENPDENTASNDESAVVNSDGETVQPPPPPEIENEETRRKRAELEELAMLGIDADDMAAQIF